MTTAVVATDGSEVAVKAARRAKELLASDTRFVALHVLTPPTPGLGDRLGDPAVYQQLEQAFRDAAEEAVKEMVDVLGADAEPRIEPGDAGSIICDVADKVGADVIVMGSHGKGVLRRALVGSTSLYVVNHASCAVLVYRE